jgi:tRNA-dihydrouridine synthase B
MGGPWILRQVMDALTGKSERCRSVSGRAISRNRTEHYVDTLGHYGNEVGVNMMRKHIGWYTKGIHGSAEFRNKVNKQADP